MTTPLVASQYDAFISVFTPNQTKNEVLEAIFVQRHALLEDAVERVDESATTGNKHHLLYVGPRGSGKTYLVTLLVHRLEQRPDITEKIHIAWLNEDETSTTILDLLLRVYRALAKRYPNVYQQDALEQVYELDMDEAQTFVTELLLESMRRENRTLLIVVENLDALFEGLADVGQKKLRALIQENPHFAIVATAQTLSDYLKKRTHPFFGFFQTTHLKPLTEKEAGELLSKISRLNGRKGVADFLRTRKGRARVRALHHLSGGNHRMYIVLSQFITQDSVDSLVGPFVKMVDELTPYYQERLRWLPAQQRKIVEFLSTSANTVSVKDIAKRLFATPQTVSSQLKDLRDKGYVTATQRGRESLYEITEPLMRICVEVKENQSHEPLALLVDFIRAWYDQSDLSQRLKDENISAVARPYLLAALEKNAEQVSEEIKIYITQTFDSSPSKPEEVIARLTKIINLDASPSEAVILAFLARGITYTLDNEFEKAIADYSTVIDLEDAPTEQIAQALFCRGITYDLNGNTERAINDFTLIVKLEGAPTKTIVEAHIYSAEAYISKGRWSEGITSVKESLKLSATMTPRQTDKTIGIIRAIFSASLDPALRKQHIKELTQLYVEHGPVTTTLGKGLVEHLGSLYQTNAELPSPENLDSWLSAWEEASEGVDELRIPMRIFRTGVAFLKTGGQDLGILADLTENERSILRQAFSMDD